MVSSGSMATGDGEMEAGVSDLKHLPEVTVFLQSGMWRLFYPIQREKLQTWRH